MNTSLQDAIKEAYAIVPVSRRIIHTLEIKQEGVQQTVYIAKSRLDVIAQDEDGNTITFVPVGFGMTLPPSNEEGTQELNISIDNINRTVTDFVDRAKASQVPVQVIYRPYASDDLTTPQMDPPLVLYLKDVQINTHQVVCRATFMDIVNKKFPSELYIRARFPTLG